MLAQKSIIENDKRPLSQESKAERASDVLGLILPCNAMLHIAFPIHR